MKKIVLKGGLFNTLNQKTKTSKSDLDLRQWLKKELSYFGINVDDPCCDNDGIPTVVDTDTRLTNPHVRGGGDLCFDTINVITNVVTPETFCIALEDLNTVTTLNIVNNTLEYKDEAGATNVIDLCPAVKLCETVTTLIDNLDGTFTYTNEAGNTVTISITSGADVLTVISAVGSVISYVDELGNTTAIDIKNLETTTNIVNNNNGSFTYTNEDNVSVTWAETVTTVTNTIVGNKIADYTSEDGTITSINESVTTMVDNLDGTYTYTNEAGTAVIVPVSSSPTPIHITLADSDITIAMDNTTAPATTTNIKSYHDTVVTPILSTSVTNPSAFPRTVAVSFELLFRISPTNNGIDSSFYGEIGYDNRFYTHDAHFNLVINGVTTPIFDGLVGSVDITTDPSKDIVNLGGVSVGGNQPFIGSGSVAHHSTVVTRTFVIPASTTYPIVVNQSLLKVTTNSAKDLNLKFTVANYSHTLI